MDAIAKPRQRQTGLVGLFGHTYKADADAGGKMVLCWQFRILRRLHRDRYVVQLFSWMDGGATEVAVLSERELLSDSVKLYANEEVWRHVADCRSRVERGMRRQA